MKALSRDKILKDEKTREPESVKELTLGHKALCDVSCLTEFRNLERLDLRFNNVESLEGLKSCTNLKWLSVVQNKLQSLKGIEGLSKLTVLNAGKNKIRSMDEVRSLTSLRALILNDNDISSICRLDQLKELNTLVLSRNPIKEIGESLVKLKKLSKLSLSNCQLLDIGSSLKCCTGLKELRLAHNEIQALPSELACNNKLQTLDLGNNVITRRSDLKVLFLSRSLKNLNLHGNPIAENEKLVKKVRKLLPELQIFNAKPIDKFAKNQRFERDNDVFGDAGEKQGAKPRDDDKGGESIIYPPSTQTKDEMKNGGDVDDGKEKKRRRREKSDIKSHGDASVGGLKNTKRKEQSDLKTGSNVDEEEKQKKRKRRKQSEKLAARDTSQDANNDVLIRSKMGRGEINAIDDAETSFVEIFAGDTSMPPENGGEKKISQRAVQEANPGTGKVTHSDKKKKKRNQSKDPMFLSPPTAEIGAGGPSTWD